MKFTKLLRPSGCLKCSLKSLLKLNMFLLLLGHISCISTIEALSPSIDTTSKSSNVKETLILHHHHSDSFNNPRADKLTSENTGNANGNQCPYVCSCIWKGGKQTATCDRRSLTALPVGLDSGTQVIDLTGNSLSLLPSNVFLERGLINLQRIHLVDCSLGKLFFLSLPLSLPLFSSIFLLKRFFHFSFFVRQKNKSKILQNVLQSQSEKSKSFKTFFTVNKLCFSFTSLLKPLSLSLSLS